MALNGTGDYSEAVGLPIYWSAWLVGASEQRRRGNYRRKAKGILTQHLTPAQGFKGALLEALARLAAPPRALVFLWRPLAHGAPLRYLAFSNVFGKMYA